MASGKVPIRMTLGIVMQFIILPLTIVGILVGFFVLGGVLFGGADDPAGYLNKVRAGSGREAWQAAYELSVLLSRDEGARRDPALAEKIAMAFRDSRDREPQIRRYLVLALGQMGNPGTVEVLIEALGDPDPETRGYAVWALGASGATEGVPRLRALLGDQDPGIRKVAAYALGHLRAAEAEPDLLPLLEDSHPDVRWNAALALSQMGSLAGLPVLHGMLDRKRLEAVPDLSDAQRQEAMINAIRAVALLRQSPSRAIVERLSRDDPDIKVRRAALEHLGTWH